MQKCKITKKEFVIKANLIHNNKYTYDNFIFTDYKTESFITCPIANHGNFLQKPHIHIYNEGGCQKCGIISNVEKRSNTIEIFMERVIKLHGNNFDYSLVKYVYSHVYVKIKCNKCNEIFLQTPYSHSVSGHGCPNCAFNKKKDTASFIQIATEVHGDKYDYSLVNYVNSKNKVIIICKQENHGQFEQSTTRHLKGRGCQKCGGTNKSTLEQVVEKANIVHKNKYTYEKLIYINAKSKGIITCPDHGDFEQTINTHLMGSGCKECSLRKSEKMVGEILKSFNINYISQYNIQLFVGRRKSKLDYYLPDYNLIIEYNGRQHYQPATWGKQSDDQAQESFKKQQLRDATLRYYCLTNNINLIEIDGRKYTGKKLINFMNDFCKKLIKQHSNNNDNINTAA